MAVKQNFPFLSIKDIGSSESTLVEMPHRWKSRRGSYRCLVIAIILMGNRELVALLNLSSWCLVMVVWLFLAVP